MNKKIALVVDDILPNKDFLERLLIQAQFDVRGAASGKEARQHLAKIDRLALAVVDIELPDESGLHLTRKLRQQYPDAYIVVATMHDQRSLMQSVFDSGGNCFLVKPHGFMELFKRVTTIELATLREGACTVIDQYGPRDFSRA
jgi:two-component system, NarL family, response regulator FusR